MNEQTKPTEFPTQTESFNPAELSKNPDFCNTNSELSKNTEFCNAFPHCNMQKTVDDPSTLYVIDNGLDFFFINDDDNKLFLDRINEIYTDISDDYMLHETTLQVTDYDFNEIKKYFKDIQNCFKSKNYEVDVLIQDITSDIVNFLTHVSNYRKYNEFITSLEYKYKPTHLYVEKQRLRGKDMNDIKSIDNSTSFINPQVSNTNLSQDLPKSNGKFLSAPNCLDGWTASDEQPGHVQRPSFNIELFDHMKTFSKFTQLSNNTKSHEYSLIYNKSYNIALVYKHTKEYPCEFYKNLCYKLDTDFVGYHTDINENIHRSFHKLTFDSFDKFTNYYLSFQKINDKPTEIINVKSYVLKYMKDNYIISTDKNSRIKFSILYDDVKDMLTINYPDITLSTTVYASCLKELGLMKKRYSDGYYYYGLDLTNNNVTVMDDFEKLISERNKLINIPDISLWTSPQLNSRVVPMSSSIESIGVGEYTLTGAGQTAAFHDSVKIEKEDLVIHRHDVKMAKTAKDKNIKYDTIDIKHSSKMNKSENLFHTRPYFG